MADELNRLKDILSNAEHNQALIGAITKQVGKVTSAVAELSALLARDYKAPAKAARKPAAEPAPGKRRVGRPKAADLARLEQVGEGDGEAEAQN